MSTVEIVIAAVTAFGTLLGGVAAVMAYRADKKVDRLSVRVNNINAATGGGGGGGAGAPGGDGGSIYVGIRPTS